MLKMQTADFTMEIGRFSSGSPGRTRTSDRVVNSHLLYRLSYRGMCDRLGIYWIALGLSSFLCPNFLADLIPGMP